MSRAKHKEEAFKVWMKEQNDDTIKLFYKALYILSLIGLFSSFALAFFVWFWWIVALSSIAIYFVGFYGALYFISTVYKKRFEKYYKELMKAETSRFAVVGGGVIENERWRPLTDEENERWRLFDDN